MGRVLDVLAEEESGDPSSCGPQFLLRMLRRIQILPVARKFINNKGRKNRLQELITAEQLNTHKKEQREHHKREVAHPKGGRGPGATKDPELSRQDHYIIQGGH